jgi:hypothetical protein
MGNQIARTAHRTTTRTDIPPSERNDRWLTPPWIVARLGVFDLDPCGSPSSSLADKTYLLENGDNGLADPWFGRVWMNPPYGKALRSWMDRMVEHGTGTALIPVATGTKLWMDVVFPNASAIHFWRHRIGFRKEGGTEDQTMVSPAASALVAFGEYDAAMLTHADFPGTVLDLRVRS